MYDNGLSIRVQKIMEKYDLNKASFARKCDLPASQTNSFLNGTDVGISKINALIDAFPEINPMWILRGEPPMFKQQNYIREEQQNSVVNDKGFCGECYVRDGRIKQLEVFNESLVRRNNELNQEIGRLKAIVNDLQQERNNQRKNTG